MPARYPATYADDSSACIFSSAASMRYASITMSWVAEENPRATAANAISVRPREVPGSQNAIAVMEAITASCATSSQPRL